MKKRLIVCADDFGLTKGVNRGIVDCCKYGVLRSASLMANGAELEHAIELAGETPQLDLGIHLCLNDLSPLCSDPLLRNLVNKKGAFFSSYSRVIKKITLDPSLVSSIKGEFRCQIDHIMAKNIKPSHINSHKHLHIYPPLWKIVVELAKEYQIPYIRYPLEKISWSGRSSLNPKGRRKTRTINDLVFFSAFFLFFSMHLWAVRRSTTWLKLSVQIPDSFCGLFDTGNFDSQSVIDHVLNVKPGITELMCHPGYVDDDLRQLPTRLLKSRAKEVDLLCSPEIKQAIIDNDVEVTSFDECNTLFHCNSDL